MSDMKCTQCGMTFKAGVAYGYACPQGLNCGPIEPVKPIRGNLLYTATPKKPVELPPMIGTATDAREAARVLLAHPAALSAIVDAMLRGANVAEPTREDAATVSQCLREALMLIGEARDD